MKRLFLILSAVLMAIGLMAENAKIYADLGEYKYAYVIPTGGVTIDEVRVINPSEVITGNLIQAGFVILPSIPAELPGKTLVVSYGRTGNGETTLYNTGDVLLQMSDASTHEVLAVFRSEGYGDNEADYIDYALKNALKLFDYSRNPQILTEIIYAGPRKIEITIENKSPRPVHTVKYNMKYFLAGKLVHEQNALVVVDLQRDETNYIKIKRDKQFRGSQYKIELEVVDYK